MSAAQLDQAAQATATLTGYRGDPAGPSSPATPGPYCLARCYCGTCPQYRTQTARVAALRQAEVDARAMADAAHEAETQQRHGGRGRRGRAATSDRGARR